MSAQRSPFFDWRNASRVAGGGRAFQGSDEFIFLPGEMKRLFSFRHEACHAYFGVGGELSANCMEGEFVLLGQLFFEFYGKLVTQ